MTDQPQRRIVILGNSGSGKTTMAKALGLPHLDMDAIAWAQAAGEAPCRRPLNESAEAIDAFVAEHEQWVIEGSYADIAEIAAQYCNEFRFLNPGLEACIAHCKARPWEPDKYASKAEQDANLAMLLDWVGQYETRDDEYGLAQHRAVFNQCQGPKHEYSKPTK